MHIQQLIGQQVDPTTKKRGLLGVTGNSLDTVGGVSLSMGLAKETLQDDFVVVRDFPYPVLLGMDFLSKVKAVIDFRKGEVTLSLIMRDPGLVGLVNLLSEDVF